MSVESVRRSAIPRDLELRFSVGRAVEVLSQLKAGRTPSDANQALTDAADELAELTDEATPPATAKSLGDYADWSELLDRVRAAAQGGSVDDMVAQLRQLATNLHAPSDEYQELHDRLRAVRRDLTRSSATIPDRASR